MKITRHGRWQVENFSQHNEQPEAFENAANKSKELGRPVTITPPSYEVDAETPVVEFFESIPTSASAIVSGAYYVAVGGTNTWAGSQDNLADPTDMDTALANAVAGNTVYLLDTGGDYTPPNDGVDPTVPAWYPANSGSDGSPITFKAYPGHTPTFNQQSNGFACIGSSQQSWHIWDGLKLVKTVATTANALMNCYQSNNTHIQNCEFVGIQSTDSANHVGFWCNSCTYLYIHHNYFHGFTSTSGANNTGAVWFFSNNNMYFYNNDIENCLCGWQSKVDCDYLYDYNNFYYQVDIPMHHQQEGIPSGTNLTFHHYNNIIVLRNAADQTVLYSFDPYAHTDTRLYNNTIYAPGASRIVYDGNGNLQTAQVYNNVVHSVGNATFCDWDSAGTNAPSTQDYNCWYTAATPTFSLNGTNYSTLASWVSGEGFDGNSINSDPSLANAGGTTPADYAVGAAACSGTGQGGADMGADHTTVGRNN